MLVQLQMWFARLAGRLRSEERGFRRLMEALPADRRLVTPYEAVLEAGSIWLCYTLYRRDDTDDIVLNLSVTVPYPVPGDPATEESVRKAVDEAVTALAESWWDRGWVDSWRYGENSGTLGSSLSLDFRMVDIREGQLRTVQEELLALLEAQGCTAAVRYVRSSADFEIFYSELTGNVICRSVSMKDAFDIVRGRYRSASGVSLNDQEELSDRDTFESLFEAGKDDIQMPELTFDQVPGEIRDIRLGLPATTRLDFTREGRERHVKAVITSPGARPVVYCLTESGDRWWTYYVDDGLLLDVCAFTSEPDACDYYLRFLEEDAYGEAPPPAYEEIDGTDLYSDDWYDDWE